MLIPSELGEARAAKEPETERREPELDSGRPDTKDLASIGNKASHTPNASGPGTSETRVLSRSDLLETRAAFEGKDWAMLEAESSDAMSLGVSTDANSVPFKTKEVGDTDTTVKLG